MYQKAIAEQMTKNHINNPNQLSKIAGIDPRTAYKAVNTNENLSRFVVGKLADAFGFDDWLSFRKYALKKANSEK